MDRADDFLLLGQISSVPMDVLVKSINYNNTSEL